MANSVVGLTIAWVPLVAMVALGRDAAISYVTAWGLLVTSYTVFRLYALGYLPFAEPVAKVTGLHARIGPGAKTGGQDGRRDRE